MPAILRITDAALKTESLAIVPAVSLNRIVPRRLWPAGNAVASISMTEPTYWVTPSAKIRPTSGVSDAFTDVPADTRPVRTTSSRSLAVIRKIAGIDVANYDVHVNVIGGGQIDGPSAGLAVVLAMLSAIQRRPLRQDVAVTGEVSIQGKIKQVGGIAEKIYGARQAGMRKIVVPEENHQDVPADVKGIDVVCASTIDDVLAHVIVRRRGRRVSH